MLLICVILMELEDRQRGQRERRAWAGRVRQIMLEQQRGPGNMCVLFIG